jgi:hypothetical protein
MEQDILGLQLDLPSWNLPFCMLLRQRDFMLLCCENVSSRLAGTYHHYPQHR